MKTKITLFKIAVVIILLLNVFTLFSQNKVTINISQDAKLLLVGDNHGNSAGTLDIAIRSEWQAKQGALGYIFIAPEIEIADLQETYKRYSANVGYTFNLGRVFQKRELENIETTASIGYGVIDHYEGFQSWGANFQISYKVFKKVKVFLDLELTERRDLSLWNEKYNDFQNRIKPSGKFGVKINIIDNCI